MAPPQVHSGAPPAEVEITLDLVRDLLEQQHPDLAVLPLVFSDSGWDNMTFRLGDDLAVRLPRRVMADQFLCNEQAWLPTLAPHLPVPVSAMVRSGIPAANYPFHWSIVTWLPGKPADLEPLAADQAPLLVAFLQALHRPAPEAAPKNQHRGVPLSCRSPATDERLARLIGEGLVSPGMVDVWHSALEAPLCRAPVWIHGDLHARNILSVKGILSGIIDWGDMCSGDPATDLDCIWMLLDDADARAQARQLYGEDDKALWLRAQGWVISIATLLLETGRQGDKRHAAMGARTLANLEADLPILG